MQMKAMATRQRYKPIRFLLHRAVPGSSEINKDEPFLIRFPFPIVSLYLGLRAAVRPRGTPLTRDQLNEFSTHTICTAKAPTQLTTDIIR